MKIVTGYTGTPHITSNDDQARNQGVFGAGNYVLDTGNKLNAVLTDATTVTLEDGDGVLQGVHFRIEPGMTEVVSISPGTTGYNRIDLICARYTKDAGTGVEDVNLVVIEGTPSASTPSAPSYTAGDILAGDTLAEFPLWKVSFSGLTPTITSVFTIRKASVELSTMFDETVNAEIPVSQTSQGGYAGTYEKTLDGVLQPGIYIITVRTSYPYGQHKDVCVYTNLIVSGNTVMSDARDFSSTERAESNFRTMIEQTCFVVNTTNNASVKLKYSLLCVASGSVGFSTHVIARKLSN